MKIVFDIDGVTRDLCGYLEKVYDIKINEWDGEFKGRRFWDMAKEHPEVWTKAKPTEYYKVIKSQKDLEFWTVQSEENKKPTLEWLNKYFDDFNVVFFKNFRQKYLASKKLNIILVDDYPNFPSFEHIISIEREYNKNVRVNLRIKSPEKLERYLKLYRSVG